MSSLSFGRYRGDLRKQKQLLFLTTYRGLHRPTINSTCANSICQKIQCVYHSSIFAQVKWLEYMIF